MDFIEAFSNAIRNAVGFQPNLCGGASQERLLDIEKELHLSLPEDVKNFYQMYNGQDEFANNLFDSFSLIPLTSIIDWHKVMRFLEKEFPKINNAVDPEIKSVLAYVQNGFHLLPQLVEIYCVWTVCPL